MKVVRLSALHTGRFYTQEIFLVVILLGYSDLLRAGRSGDRIPVEEKFSAPVQTGPGGHPAPCKMGTGSFPGVKWPGRGVDHPSPSSAEVEGIHLRPPLGLRGLFYGELYLYLYLFSFLLEAEAYCGRKDYVNEKFQWHRRELNPRPSGLLRSAATNCATASPTWQQLWRNFTTYFVLILGRIMYVTWQMSLLGVEWNGVTYDARSRYGWPRPASSSYREQCLQLFAWAFWYFVSHSRLIRLLRICRQSMGIFVSQESSE